MSQVQSGKVSKQAAVPMDAVYATQVEKRKKMTFEERQRDLRNRQARDAEEVTGIFKNLENPRGSLSFALCLYPGDEFETYYLVDNERYRLPRGVARHLNNNCYYKEYKHMSGEMGESGIRNGLHDGRLKTQNMQAATKVHRFSFQSLEFMDDDLNADLRPANLVEVTVSP